MELAPRFTINIAFGASDPVQVEYSLSPFGADDTPRQLLIHRAESAGIDLLRQWGKSDIDLLAAAIQKQIGL